jgi:hypothetical protein
MARSNVDPYVEGDRIEAADGSIGYVRSCRSSTGLYLKVYVSRGPRTGQWIYPERFGAPAIHWSTDGREVVCPECDRRFRTDAITAPSDSVLVHVFCRTCEAKQRLADQRRSDSTDAIRVGDLRRRVPRV